MIIYLTVGLSLILFNLAVYFKIKDKKVWRKTFTLSVIIFGITYFPFAIWSGLISYPLVAFYLGGMWWAFIISATYRGVLAIQEIKRRKEREYTGR